MGPFPNTVRRLSSADGGVLLDIRRGVMFRINPIGARVLDLLEEGNSSTQIAEALSSEFQVPVGDVQTDVREFLESLKNRGVLEPK